MMLDTVLVIALPVRVSGQSIQHKTSWMITECVQCCVGQAGSGGGRHSGDTVQ